MRKLRSCASCATGSWTSAAVSALFLAVAYWGGGIESDDANKLVWKSSSVVGLELHSLEAVAERRMMDMMNTVLNNPSHPLGDELWQMDSTFSYQLIPPKSKALCFRRSLVPTAITATVTMALSQLWPPQKHPHLTHSHSARPVTLTAHISDCSNSQTQCWKIDFFYICWTMIHELHNKYGSKWYLHHNYHCLW